MSANLNELPMPKLKQRIRSRAGRIAELQMELDYLNKLYAKKLETG